MCRDKVAECFDFSVTHAVESVSAAGSRVYKNGHTGDQVRYTLDNEKLQPISGARKPVWIVGGFGSSKWLLKRLRVLLGPSGYEFCQPSDSNLHVSTLRQLQT